MTGSQAELLRVTYSTAAADAVAAFVGAGYDLPEPLECILLRRGFNDCFAISAPNEARYVFRVSGHRRRGDADVDTETRFLAYLDSVGVPVATAVVMAVPTLGAESVTVKVSLFSTAVSQATSTVTTLLVSPGAKLTVPLGRTPPTKSAASAGLVPLPVTA